ncbi:MAG TPA: glycoside hydrolase family 2 TIM barrel-domain containing protein [Cyclobacteriaceae bacterium]|jgi:mannan endo-1,4-beta-mannosidase|nr:glycoside hydrolase family 2 TIM barrel-domain containing protein [Cyclobacteriaceae bacterium]
MKKYFYLILLVAVVFVTGCKNETHFVKVKGTQFMIGDKPYYFMGTNFWYGLNLGSKDAGGDRERLLRELDRLKELGVNNLRVVAGSEGPDKEPYRMVPALQTAAGVYNEEVFDGLDFLLSEMKKRDMYAIMCLNNFWNWSGGMGQYMVWAGVADSIPYPPPHPGGNWDVYQKFAAKFYSSEKAVELFNNHIKEIVARKNTYINLEYKNDPTIMAWELGNEPRGVNNVEAYSKWIGATSALIKQLDPNHLVTTGSEGKTSSSYSGTDPEKDHVLASIDYQTIHIWVQNWNIYNPAKADSTLPVSIDYAQNYLNEHVAISQKINKPMVLEEFGISRDGNSHEPSSTTKVRDEYYDRIFGAVYQRAATEHNPVAGVNFWAWAGEGRPRVAEGMWKAGDNFIGDPPHEPQGWYSVYDKDTSTQKVIKKYSDLFNALGKK